MIRKSIKNRHWRYRKDKELVMEHVRTLFWSRGLWPIRLLYPKDFPGKNTGVGCHFLLQGIFPTQGLNSHLRHWWEDSLPLIHLGKPRDILFHSVQLSHSVMSNSLQPHGLQHTRLPCPSSTPGACSNSCLLSQWWHPTILSSVIPFSFCSQFFPASGSFPVSWFFVSGNQSIGASASASVLPKTIRDWFPLGLTGWISLQSKRLSRIFSITTVQKQQFFGSQLSL